ncbi:unnamed protein product [Larinioides sclopetarius]|uniref:Uncharacterized protein n=1 Tax=Larinioides sclopetarius TaxID=280406 RepID=A0AAV1Z5M2_9ARAC
MKNQFFHGDPHLAIPTSEPFVDHGGNQTTNSCLMSWRI